MAGTSISSALIGVLSDRGVEERFHPLLAELSSGELDYIQDIGVEDIEGRLDGDGAVVTAPVAKGLVRKLRKPWDSRQESSETAAPRVPASDTKTIRVPALMRNASNEARSVDTGACVVSLTCSPEVAGPADRSLVRCALRGELPKGGSRRGKVLAVVLDRSGSMAGAMWCRVVSAVTDVVTDELLQDPCMSLVLVVFSDQAVEVRLPQRASELRELLLREYSPQGGTSFKAAFALTEKVVRRELSKLLSVGRHARDVDLAALVFTDGEDTSVKGARDRHGIRLVDKDASRAAARAAGDAFREALRGTGCATHVCVAAFGADHDPDQCQYLSDRYCYINRSETLADALAGGLGALLSSAGQCSLHLQLPAGLSLEEPLPASIALDSAGRLDHHVWLRVNGGQEAQEQRQDLFLVVEVAGAPVLRGSAARPFAAEVGKDSFDGHLFLVDLVALRLRRMARELCGRRPSVDELCALRKRLTETKERLQPTRSAAGSAKGCLRGRAALRERLAEVDAARERLSYALGQFDDQDTNDQRQIGSVAIDAILRDAGQHVPQGPAAAELTRRAALAESLPPPEALSTYGAEYTLDGYSCCDARELASQGDALFFQLGSASPFPGGVGFVAVDDSAGTISYEAFQLLSHDGRQPVKSSDPGEGFTHLGVPVYVTEGHFMRANLLLPDVLRRLSPNGVYQAGASERQFLSLLGRSLAMGPAKTEAQLVALLHKARSVRAILASTRDPTQPASEGASLLDACCAEAARFVAEPASRPECADLYAVAAAGVLSEAWGEQELALLASAVAEEAFRRRLSHALRGAGEAQSLCLMWALLGAGDEDDAWLDSTLPCSEVGELRLSGGGFSPFTAPDELERLEVEWPGKAAPCKAGADALLAILSSKRSACDNGPQPCEWASLREQLPAWGRATRTLGGTAKLWRTLDALMMEDSDANLVAMRTCVAELKAVSTMPCLRAAFVDVAAITRVAAAVCLGGDASEGPCLRTLVAGALRTLVEKRKALVCKYPITGSDFPRLDEHSKESVHEVWGMPAYPVDPELHHKAMLRVWRRTMKTRITSTIKEALSDKEYRRRGGKFAFPAPMDTFIRGLHRRTADLHEDWRQRLKRDTAGSDARAEAVEEMLLRLRWDDSDKLARERLSKIVSRIWDGMEGIDLTSSEPIPSALWLGEDCCTSLHVSLAGELPPTAPTEAAEVAESILLDSAAAIDSEPPATAEPAPVTIGERAEREPDNEAVGARYPIGVDAARSAMDEGLQAALDALDTGLMRRLEAFADMATPGRRVKLPLSLSAKQRKAVHLWAEMRGLQHTSFGYRGRRRLHLVVPGGESADGVEQAEEDFDWDAWQENDGEEGASEHEDAW